MNERLEFAEEICNYVLTSVNEDFHERMINFNSIVESNLHQPIYLFSRIDSMIKTAVSKIVENLEGFKYYNYFESLDFERENMTKQTVINLHQDKISLFNYILTSLEKCELKNEDDYSNELWLNKTIAFNVNFLFRSELIFTYEKLKVEHKKAFSIHSKKLSKHLLKNGDNDVSIEKFEWTTNSSNLSFLFKLLERFGYLKYPKGNLDLAVDNLLLMFDIDYSKRASMKEYLGEIQGKISEKETTFSKACEKAKTIKNSLIFELPQRKYLRK